MDAQKRQKIMLAVVAVLALGAGSYWFLGRDSGGASSAAVDTGPVVRKEKVASEAPVTKRKADPARATAKRDEPEAVERKEREAPEETTVERKKKREEKAKEKKKTQAPAA